MVLNSLNYHYFKLKKPRNMEVGKDYKIKKHSEKNKHWEQEIINIITLNDMIVYK